MSRLAVAAALLLSGITTHAAQAQDEDVQAVAQSAGVAANDLRAALQTVREAGYDVSASEYECRTDHVGCPEPPLAIASTCGWPICGPLGARLYCIEGFESRHNGAAVNPSSGAAGWLQWLPSTARRWGVVIGNRASEWNATAQIAALDQRFFTSQWVVLQRGLC